jgi:hypothetical protein
MRWIIDRTRRVLCALHGHDTVLHFEQDRLSLHCLFCSYETTGWSLRPDPDPSSRNLVSFASGVRFAEPSARADRFGDVSAAGAPETGGRQSHAMRLAS